MVLLPIPSESFPPLCLTLWTGSVLSWWRRETRCGVCHGGCCRINVRLSVCWAICLFFCLCLCDFIDASGSQTDAKDLLHHEKFITHAHCSTTTTMTILQIRDHLSKIPSENSSDAFEAFQDASLWYKNCTLIYVEKNQSPQRLAFLP